METILVKRRWWGDGMRHTAAAQYSRACDTAQGKCDIFTVRRPRSARETFQ